MCEKTDAIKCCGICKLIIEREVLKTDLIEANVHTLSFKWTPYNGHSCYRRRHHHHHDHHQWQQVIKVFQ